MAIPTYQPSQVQAGNAPALQYSADQFGGQTGAAAERLGQTLGHEAERFSAIEQQAKERQDSAKVMAAYAKASDKLRSSLYGDGGLFTRQGAAAEGLSVDVNKTSRQIFNDTIAELVDPDQKVAFDQMWQRKHEGTMDQAGRTEFDALQTYRTQAKQAALTSVAEDAINNYRDPAALQANLDAARAMIRANPDGLPPEAVKGLERDTISHMQVELIRRLAADDPGDALDYYEAHQDQVSGTDHTAVQQIIGGVAEARQASQAVDEIAGNGHAVTMAARIYGDDPAAAPPIAVDPGVALQVSRTVGDSSLEGKTPEEVKTYLASPEGRATSQRVASAYLGQQLQSFGGDVEAALIATHEGPDAARAFLDHGRDYSVLQEPEETAKAVASEVARYSKAPVRGNTSADIQAALHGTSTTKFAGDAQAYLGDRFKPTIAGDKMALDDETSNHLAALISDGPEEVAAGIHLVIAKDGSADLGWQDGSFTDAPEEVQTWVHENAARYGLTFPHGSRPWHIEAAPEGPATNDGTVVGLPVALKPETGNAADLYGKPQGAFQLSGMQGDLSDWIAAAEVRYRDNPSLRAEVERQLTNTWNTQKAEKKDADVQALKDGFGLILQGKKITDIDPQTLQAMGPDNVSKLLTLEGKFQKGGDNSQTDDATYYELSKLDPVEFSKVNLIDYADKLSGADFRAMADKQATIARGGGDGAAVAGTRTRLQIVSDTLDMLGLKPNSKPDDAAKANLLNRQVDDLVTQFAAENKRPPNSEEVQKIVDGLIVQGHQRTSGMDEWFGGHFFGLGMPGNKSGFELTPEERKSFVVADDFGQVPPEAHDVIARGFQAIHGENASEQEATDFYNDMARVKLGAIVPPPPALQNEIAQGLAQRLNRRPTDDEIALAYTRMVKASTGM